MKLGNPREETRKLTRNEIVQIRRQRTANKKKDWKSFVGFIRDNPEALMSIVATPVEPEDIIHGLIPGHTTDKDLKITKGDHLRNSQSIKSQNRSELTRIHSGVSNSVNKNKNFGGNRRPLTGVQRSQGVQNIASAQYAQFQKGFKSRPQTGNPRANQTTRRFREMEQYGQHKNNLEIFSNDSKSKVETVLRLLNRNNTTPSCTDPPVV